MQNIRGNANFQIPPWMEWTKKDSEELVLLYLTDYYKTLDDYYLEKALQIAKDDYLDFDNLMRRARFQLA
jgi:hypothetical protein